MAKKVVTSYSYLYFGLVVFTMIITLLCLLLPNLYLSNEGNSDSVKAYLELLDTGFKAGSGIIFGLIGGKAL